MKIALIMVKGNIYSFKNRSLFFKYMPDSLTLGTLHGIVRKHFPDAEIEIYDETVEKLNLENIKADIVGLSALTPCINKAYEYAEYFKSKHIPVFIGGVHATMCPDEVSQHCDSVLFGLADETLPELIKDFSNNSLKKIYRQSPEMMFENLAFPSRHIYEEKSLFASELNMVQATFGCSNVCEFCVQPYVCSGYHQRPVEEVIEEIKLIEDDYVEFLDPNLAKDETYLKDLCEKLVPLKKQWFAPMTIGVSRNDELLAIMKKAGCVEILIGFESVNQDSVKDINKGFNSVADYKECIKKLHSYGIKITGSFVLGLDGDDENVFEDTLKFVTESNIDYLRYTINTPYPGTKYFEKMKKEDRVEKENWNFYDCQSCVIKPAKMSSQVVEVGHKWLWKKSYEFKNIVKRLNYIDSCVERWTMILKNYIFGKVYIRMIFKKNF